MSVQDNINLEKRFYDIYNKRAFNEGEKLIAENCEFIIVPFNIKGQGVEGYKNIIGGWATAFPDSRVEIVNMVANDDTVVIEFWATGTHNGVLRTPNGEIQPTGKQVSLPYIEVSKIKNGKVVQNKLYYDALTLLSQMGLINSQDLLKK